MGYESYQYPLYKHTKHKTHTLRWYPVLHQSSLSLTASFVLSVFPNRKSNMASTFFETFFEGFIYGTCNVCVYTFLLALSLSTTFGTGYLFLRLAFTWTGPSKNEFLPIITFFLGVGPFFAQTMVFVTKLDIRDGIPWITKAFQFAPFCVGTAAGVLLAALSITGLWRLCTTRATPKKGE